MQINLSLVLLAVASCSGQSIVWQGGIPSNDPESTQKRSEMIGKMKFLKEEEAQTHYIVQGEPKMFVYLLQWDVEYLTITVTPCSVPVAWSVRNMTKHGHKVNMNLSNWTLDSFSMSTHIYEERNATQRFYQVVVDVGVSGSVEIFVSVSPVPVSQLRPTANVTVTSRRHKGQLSVRWPPSSVSPHAVSYWLVLTPSTPAKSLCSAKIMAGLEANSNIDEEVIKGNITIENLGSRTSSIIKGLKPDHNYTVEVFVVNNLTGLSYRYGTATARYMRTRPLPLRDGRQTDANLRKMDGRATFRYKVPKATPLGGRLEWYVAVCGTGTVVDAEVRHKRRPIIERREIVGYSIITLNNPVPSATYILRINSTEPEMLARITQVQVLATTKGLHEPILPKLTSVHEHKSARSCRSVQLGWYPSSPSPSSNGTNFLTYCITTKEVHKSEMFTPTPDQCAHSLALKNHDYSTNLCFRRTVNKKMITKEVTHLKPWKFYDIQVAVRNGNSKVLSYEKIRVRTKQHCHR
uniref:Protein NDNF n=1 Tax=Lygus hesperus TaxID=30085 RepID=A0A146LJB6_LYGHE